MKRHVWFLNVLILFAIVMVVFWLPVQQAFYTGEMRAAMDIGSGATNLKVAKVDPKTNKITFTLFEKSIPVPYQKHLEKSTDQTFDPEVMNQGIETIKKLKKIADTYHVKNVIAVATAAFRKAKNAEEFAKEIQKETGVQVRIINQDEEGILAFRGALAVTTAKPEHTVTWDIGGGSMQLTTLTNEGTYLVEKGNTASIPFKNDVIEKIQNKDLKIIHSPNPMTMEQIHQAIQHAENFAKETAPFIKQKVQDPQIQILAVGSLFNFGIKPLVKSSIVRPEALKKEVMEYADKTDSELPGGSLAEVAVTNPILVLGYMQGLQMKQVEVVNVNNADGALTYPPYWQAGNTS